MKKNLIYFFTSCLLYSTTAICQDADFVIPQNPDQTITADDGTRITSHDVYSMTGKLKRKVTLVNPRSNSVIGEIFIRLESANPDVNMYDQLDKAPEKFSGSLTIETAEGVIYKKYIIDGETVDEGSVSGKATGGLGGGPGPFYNPGLSCSFSNIHDCVAYKIEGMNWVNYALCLVRAPLCYLQQWAVCTYEVCVRHMQYTNPN
jgi:hypothetical protein